MSFGKSDSKGRSSGKHGGKFNDRLGPKKGQSWTWITQELIISAPWRRRTLNCVRFIEFLLADHMANAGQENGRLKATYDQLQKWGIRRPGIRPAIDEAEFLGLVRLSSQGGRYGTARKPSEYRLTFHPVIVAHKSIASATNEWKGITIEMVHKYHTKTKELRKATKQYRKKQFYGSDG
ncbi:MAG: hypothetical protein COA93_07255 [Alphaproteobacteria bacterium]|nr:MAG: hypothetical protein COA93_07255 [Alphaproteobacteria bacterium]